VTSVTSTSSKKGRVVVTDDSRLMRRMLADALTRQGFEVVGSAADGDEALELCRQHRPDALTLDLHMPGVDGLGVLKALRDGKAEPVPVVVVSAFSPAHGARAVDALACGAFDLVAKPAIGEGMDNFTAELGRKVAEAAHAGRARRVPRPAIARRPGAVSAPAVPRHPGARPIRRATGTKKLVLIACSTGGPKALGELMPALPGRLGSGTLIVQHMPPGFTASLATRLDGSSKLTVREAAGGEILDPSVALIAPGGSHLRLGGDRRTLLNDDPPEGGLKPRADYTIEDAARLFGSRLLLVVLTGMGRDGLRGAKAVKATGGTILVEAENTCTVYRMPRAIAEAGLADEVLDLGELPAAIAREAS
jgi:two-component system, chemotaxis family, protein-glutamate methylesterase/glutaminase